MWTIRYDTAQLVSRHRGTLPIVLACPHNGSKTPRRVPVRTGKGLPARCQFNIAGDDETRAVTIGIAQRLLALSGEAPYVVIADFHRKYIDANRSADCAYEVAAAKPPYDEYHRTLRDFVNEVRAEGGGAGLLFDVHGTKGLASDPADLYLGTVDGASVDRLLKIDPHALSRRRGLAGLLTAAGYVVSVNPAQLGGGHTVATYGSSHADGVDAIQIEIAAPHRKDARKRAALIEHLAVAMHSLADRYARGAILASFQAAQLLDAAIAPHPIGRLQRRAASRDSRLRLGGEHDHRGRLELRHDPASPRRAGVLVLYDETGKEHFFWVDPQGVLRTAPSDPGSSSKVGRIVGEQP